jgi:hypothetical protein
VIPQNSDREIYLQRYRDRGSDQAFIDLVNKNWDGWLNAITLIDRAEHPFEFKLVTLNNSAGVMSNVPARNIQELIESGYFKGLQA